MSLDAPRGTHAVARRLAQLLAVDDGEQPALARLSASQPPARVVAVDGSSVVLAETGDMLLAAFRAGWVGLEKGAPVASSVPAPEVVLLAGNDPRALLAERLERAGFPPHALPRLDASGVLDALRTLDELLAARAAIARLDEGDLLLLDGPLQARAHVPLTDLVLADAAARGVDVVGVSKSTSIALGGAPALVACQLHARALGDAPWMAPLPTPPHVRGATYAARLSRADERAFRFDVASAREARDVLASVATLCGHPAYPGYPSPLAMAHNAVLVNDDARRQLRAHVQDAAIAAGVAPRAWDAAFVDYHEILELGA